MVQTKEERAVYMKKYKQKNKGKIAEREKKYDQKRKKTPARIKSGRFS